MTPTLTIIVGPTGSGKSDLAINLARRLGAPIVSTDSRQVYRGMAIGTAQPTQEQLRAVPHYFIADREPTERFTCADFEREALALLGELFATCEHVVAVGGSGLYIDALCGGLDPLPDVDPALREELSRRLADEGPESLAAQLKLLDPAYHATLDTRNPARVLRGLEVCLATGRPFSEQRTGRKTPRPFAIRKIVSGGLKSILPGNAVHIKMAERYAAVPVFVHQREGGAAHLVRVQTQPGGEAAHKGGFSRSQISP